MLRTAAVEVVLPVAPDFDFVGGVEAVELVLDVVEGVEEGGDVGVLDGGRLEGRGWDGVVLGMRVMLDGRGVGGNRVEREWADAWVGGEGRGRRGKSVRGRGRGNGQVLLERRDLVRLGQVVRVGRVGGREASMMGSNRPVARSVVFLLLMLERWRERCLHVHRRTGGRMVRNPAPRCVGRRRRVAIVVLLLISRRIWFMSYMVMVVVLVATVLVFARRTCTALVAFVGLLTLIAKSLFSSTILLECLVEFDRQGGSRRATFFVG